MGDPFKKVRPGEKLEIPAEAFNAFIDAARDLKMRQRSETSGEPAGPQKQTGIMLVRNETGADRQRFDIVGLKSPIISPANNAQEFQNRPSFIGEAPRRQLGNGHIGRFGVLQEPCANGAIVPAVVSGITVVRINVVAEWHEKADVQTDGYSELISGETGSATILWKESGVGTRWAIVRLDDWVVDEFWARLGAATNVGPNRWKYSFEEVVKNGAGYGAWATGGFNRTGEAFNSVEDPNDGAGIEGNGVDIDALCNCLGGDQSSSSGQSCCRLLPAGIGAIVRMKEVRFGNGTQPQVEYWFQYENEIDCCPEGSSSSESSSSESSSSESSSSESSSSESSSSESSSSESSSSESSSSEGSSSESSSSTSSSSTSSSSTSSSSSASSSESSSSAPSGSGSSGSSGEPCNCVTIITNVSLDENGCLRITSREICMPVDCPMGDEYAYSVCPPSSSGESSGSASGSSEGSSSGSGESSGSASGSSEGSSSGSGESSGSASGSSSSEESSSSESSSSENSSSEIAGESSSSFESSSSEIPQEP